MRKIGATLSTTALAVVVFAPLPATAFGIHLGRFYFHLPFGGHHYHRHHPNPNEARTRPNDVSRSGGDSTTARGRNAAEQADREARAETNTEALKVVSV